MSKFRHVLLIDDNKMDNFITNRYLTKANIADKITIFDSAVDALQYLNGLQQQQETFPDLILLDIQMPIMDGFGFLKEFTLNKLAAPENCSIVMLSSSTDISDITRALYYPIVKKYQSKPISLEVLNSL